VAEAMKVIEPVLKKNRNFGSYDTEPCVNTQIAVEEALGVRLHERLL
jgi:hypothetical protein